MMICAKPRPARTTTIAAWLIGVAVLFQPLPSWALGLGGITLRSALGQPLLAEIELIGAGDAPLDAACFRLAPGSDAETGYPWLRRGRLTPDSGGRANRLILTTRTPLWDPLLEVGIDVTCGAGLSRRYTLLPQPLTEPQLAAAAASPAETPAEVSAGAEPAEPTQAASPTEKRPARRHRTRPAAGAAPAAQPPSGQAAAPATTAARKSGRRKEDRLVLGAVDEADLPSLALTVSLGDPGRIARTDAAERERWRQEQRVFFAQQSRDEAFADMQSRIRSLEEEISRLKVDASAANPPANMAAPTGAASAVAASAGEPVPRAAAASGTSPAAIGALLLSLVGSAALLALLLRRRGSRQPLPEAAETAVTAAEQPTTPAEPGADDDQSAAPGPPPPQDLPAVPVVTETPPVDDNVTHWATPDEEDSVVELADVLQALGMGGQARDTLAAYVAAHPKKAISPWLKLLQLYYDAGHKAEFEVLANQLHASFNIDVVRWDAYARSDADATIEQFAHIVERLIKLWPTPACAEYLWLLLTDNRNGQRRGLPVETIDEILMLSRVLRTR